MPNPLMQMMNGMGGNPLNVMQNNPMIKMISMLKNGGNPMSMLQQMAGNNPDAQKVLGMLQNGNTQGLKDMAMNMAKERGTSVEEIAKQLGIQLPE